MPEPVKPSGHPPADVTPAQLRAARALLGWSQDDLAKIAEVAPRTIKTIELAAAFEPAPGRQATIERLVAALVAAGIRFAQEPGAIAVALTIPKAAQRPTARLEQER